MSAPDFSYGIGELADLIYFQVGAWHDFGYQVPPSPESKTIPPLGERSAGAICAAREAIAVIDQLTGQLGQLRDQLITEMRQDEDIRSAHASDCDLAHPDGKESAT